MKFRHLNIAVFLITLLVLGGMNMATSKASVYIETENRMTKESPEFSSEELFSGNYFKDYEAFFSDNFVLRSTFVSTSKAILANKGLQQEDKVEIIEFAGANIDMAVRHDQVAVEDSELVEEVSETGETIEGEVAQTNLGKIFIYDNKAMELNFYNEVATRNYAEVINKYANRFADVSVGLMMIPTQVEFIDNNAYRELSISQRTTLDWTYTFLDDTVKVIDVYDSLKDHSDEYIYFGTDHHWTQRGAFYAYQVLREQLGLAVQTVDDYDIEIHEQYLGSLFKVSASEVLKNNPDYIEIFQLDTPHDYYALEGYINYGAGHVYVDKFLDTDQKYGVFLGGDSKLVKIETDNIYGRNIVVLKDSYANAFIPFLIQAYDNIVVVDPRLFEGTIDDVIAEHEITDILFLNYALINRYDGYSKLYDGLLKGD